MIRVFSIGVFVLALGLLSCNTSRKTTASSGGGDRKGDKQKIACSQQAKDDSQPRLEWIIEDTSVLSGLKTMERPSSYKVYSLDSVQAKTFFRSFNDTSRKQEKIRMTLPLPAPNECKAFDVSNSRVMNKKLKEKYPELVTLQGRGTDGKGDARINYDGIKVKIQVNMNGEIILINPIRHNGRTYYVAYARADSRDKKESFEENGTPANENKR